MSNRVFFGLLFLAAAVVMAWFAFKGQPLPFKVPGQTGPTGQSTSSAQNLQDGPDTVPAGPDQVSGQEKGGVAARTVVMYTDTGFGPVSVTVTVGSTVTFVNESSKGMWVASAVHPTHLVLPGFDQLAQVSRGGMYEYTFAKTGTWQYHNHVNPTDMGTVVVTQ